MTGQQDRLDLDLVPTPELLAALSRRFDERICIAYVVMWFLR
jgi:hypothetical protein